MKNDVYEQLLKIVARLRSMNGYVQIDTLHVRRTRFNRFNVLHWNEELGENAPRKIISEQPIICFHGAFSGREWRILSDNKIAATRALFDAIRWERNWLCNRLFSCDISDSRMLPVMAFYRDLKQKVFQTEINFFIFLRAGVYPEVSEMLFKSNQKTKGKITK